MAHQFRWSVPAVTICPGTSDWKEKPKLMSATVMTSTTLLRLGQQSLVRGRYRDGHFNLPAPQRLYECWTSSELSALHAHVCHQSILMTFLTGFCRGRYVVGCCSEARVWDHKETLQQILSATCSDTGHSKVSDTLRSQWSDADLAQHDWNGKSRGAKTATARATTQDLKTQISWI